jgi:hypothetical protein
MGIVDQIKELALLAQKVRNIELYEKLVSFQSDIVALQEENHDLRAKLQQLTEQLNLQAKGIWENPFYWVKETEAKDGPFCQKCYDSDHKLIRLQDQGNDIWNCFNCKSYFYGPRYVPPRDGPDPSDYDPLDHYR